MRKEVVREFEADHRKELLRKFREKVGWAIKEELMETEARILKRLGIDIAGIPPLQQVKMDKKKGGYKEALCEWVETQLRSSGSYWDFVREEYRKDLDTLKTRNSNFRPF